MVLFDVFRSPKLKIQSFLTVIKIDSETVWMDEKQHAVAHVVLNLILG